MTEIHNYLTLLFIIHHLDKIHELIESKIIEFQYDILPAKQHNK